ncbi:sulfite reductase (NADPH) flavoprotein alpha-component [Dyadobacter koreensis]|uniref:NADPH--hemoprotein reductase n=1 Tax=Dyadobacter koreensis TaxID=408657 RepID=A0A1H6QNM1_9BACT|nr:PepSY domain-containing protein [Dyadobacter koreensis]SEI41787.1 sulfite reductase (NADPH) flavoprotein alpha-component [Dyadobacter koreensis]
MTISIWRYSHLALAVSSFLFLALASLTGIILAFQPISEKIQPYRSENFDQADLSQVLPVLRSKYPGITDISVDANEFILVNGSDEKGEKLSVYVDPLTGKILGTAGEKNEFFEWVTGLHRSLFLHEAGRFVVGLTAFLLVLITISGIILILQRQRGVKRFFAKIQRDHFAQYYHVVTGRLSLIPILILALTGTFLSLERFGLFNTTFKSQEIDFDALKSGPPANISDFAIFKKTKVSQLQSIEFPFSQDVEDFYTLKLKDRELTVNQITGEVITQTAYPLPLIISKLSLNLHTGRADGIWAAVLALASANILFFIYSGFTITLRRRSNRIKNKFKADQSEFIILVGSENGSTFYFASAIHQQLIAAGKTAYLTELNSYTHYAAAKHIIVMTATYGLGDAPTNAAGFQAKLIKYPQTGPIDFSVVGFGSHAYPDFCKFAFEVNNLLAQQPWASPLLEIYTVNDKSPEQFNQWAADWSQHAEVPTTLSAGPLKPRQQRKQPMLVMNTTQVHSNGEAFLIRFRPKRRQKFSSGDLLAIYPAADHRERLYSIGKIGKEIQLSVKLHANGLGSTYLARLKAGDSIQACLLQNPDFHLPPNVPAVLMICNGTGIAPFLGMIDQLSPKTNAHLYCGFRGEASFQLYKQALEESRTSNKLNGLHIAYSREGRKEYVKDMLERDRSLIADVLVSKGVIMLCGSLSMQNNVSTLLEQVCQNQLGKSLSYYQSRSQVLMDCY